MFEGVSRQSIDERLHRTIEIVLFSRPQMMLEGWVIRFSWCSCVHRQHSVLFILFFLLHLFYEHRRHRLLLLCLCLNFDFCILLFISPRSNCLIKRWNRRVRSFLTCTQSHSEAFNRDSLHSKPLSRFCFPFENVLNRVTSFTGNA